MEKGEVMASKDNAPDFIQDDDMPDFIPDEQAPNGDVVSGFDPKRPLMSAMGAISGLIDPYTGAPTRAAIGAAMEGGGISGAAEAARKQFGMPSEQAPSGRELSERAGVPSSISPYTGMAVDVLADPLTLAPSGLFRSAGKMAGRGASKVLPKVGEALSGIPAKEIRTFSKDFKRVEKMIKEYRDAPDVAADVIREGYQNKLQSFRRGVNRELETALSGAAGEQRISVAPVMDALDAQKAKLNQKLYGSDVAAIDEVKSTVASLADESGSVSTKELHEIKQFLDGLAKPAWSSQGQIFPKGDKVAQASKQAANIARKEVNKVSPAVKEANQKLASLRQIEDKINKNLLAPGKPEGALRSAGSGGNMRARSQLERLGKATGQDFLSDAEALAAFERFRDIGLLPVDFTGKSVLRAGLGGALGYGVGGPLGGLAGLASPAAIKYGITGYERGISPVLSKLPSATKPIGAARGIGVEERKRRLKALEGK